MPGYPNCPSCRQSCGGVYCDQCVGHVAANEYLLEFPTITGTCQPQMGQPPPPLDCSVLRQNVIVTAFDTPWGPAEACSWYYVYAHGASPLLFCCANYGACRYELHFTKVTEDGVDYYILTVQWYALSGTMPIWRKIWTNEHIPCLTFNREPIPLFLPGSVCTAADPVLVTAL